MHFTAPDSLAHASIPVPRGMLHLGKSRLDLYLRATAKDQYRWFHADGAPTVIEAETPAKAVAVARTLWRDLRIVPQQLQQMEV